MRRVWATVVGVWATLAIVAAIAWSNRAPSPLPRATPTVLVVKGKNGRQQLVVVGAQAPVHATTQTSPAPPA
jgi:hypothetical protein